MSTLPRDLALPGLLCLVVACSGASSSGGSPGGGDPCAHVTCSGHGSCVASGTSASCSCEAGYHAAGVLCVPDGSTDPCAGLVTDTSPHPMTALTKPELGKTVADPQFGTTIRRITAVGGTGVIKPVYSPTQAWNADESYLILYQVGHGHLLYDGRTYAYVRDLPIAPPDLEQVYWSTTDPDALYWIDGNVLTRYRVSTGKNEAVHTIAACSGQVRADSHAWSSWDSNFLGLYCESTGNAFIYELDSGTAFPQKAGGSAPFIAASGTLAYWGGKVVDRSLNTLRTLDLGSAEEHCSLGALASGHDTYNLVQFDAGPKGSGVGSLVTFDMTDGSSRVVVGPATGYPYPPSGTHVSAPIYRRPGWVFVSIVGDVSGAGVLDQELLLADTNPGGTVCRIGHHRSQEQQDYWGEPHVSGSPSGTRALFASDWGGGPSVDTYVVELPSYVP